METISKGKESNEMLYRTIFFSFVRLDSRENKRRCCD
jgi:hypothetical protein